ncbi:hypothetical protein F5144DRAFT_565848 [Chaetomium tenue]|uniref:Uncharacterized protein n=1 Tax=Chaetomium tenue TaxID=1854479 RepID=A0ACB7P9T2_9PEZI|nr:hypothetical protein F5144DRAFT_565848 [Chaetomium globosum]
MYTLDVELVPFEKPVFETPELVKSLLVARGLSWDQDLDYVYPCPPGQTEFLKQGARDEQMWVLNTVRRMSASIDQNQWIAATQALAQANGTLRTSCM